MVGVVWGIVMALRTCPDCKSQVSDQAKTCIKCGRPFTIKRPVGSVGACPACGSLMTGDFRQEDRKQGGLAQEIGGIFGCMFASKGRYFCKSCNHTWKHGLDV